MWRSRCRKTRLLGLFLSLRKKGSAAVPAKVAQRILPVLAANGERNGAGVGKHGIKMTIGSATGAHSGGKVGFLQIGV